MFRVVLGESTTARKLIVVGLLIIRAQIDHSGAAVIGPLTAARFGFLSLALMISFFTPILEVNCIATPPLLMTTCLAAVPAEQPGRRWGVPSHCNGAFSTGGLLQKTLLILMLQLGVIHSCVDGIDPVRAKRLLTIIRLSSNTTTGRYRRQRSDRSDFSLHLSAQTNYHCYVCRKVPIVLRMASWQCGRPTGAEEYARDRSEGLNEALYRKYP